MLYRYVELLFSWSLGEECKKFPPLENNNLNFMSTVFATSSLRKTLANNARVAGDYRELSAYSSGHKSVLNEKKYN